MIRQGSVRLTVSHPPETVVERSREDAAVGVVPTHDASGPAQALGIGEKRGVGIEGLPPLVSGQFDQRLSIQTAADVIDRQCPEKALESRGRCNIPPA